MTYRPEPDINEALAAARAQTDDDRAAEQAAEVLELWRVLSAKQRARWMAEYARMLAAQRLERH